MKLFIRSLAFLSFFACFSFDLLAQDHAVKQENTALIDSLLNAPDVGAAKAELDKQIVFYTSAEKYDSLVNYIRFIGNPKLSDNKWAPAIRKAEHFVTKLLNLNNPVIAKNAYLQLADLYDDKGDAAKAYSVTLEALEASKKIQDPKVANQEGIYYDLGRRAFNMGDIALSKKHQLKNLYLRKKNNDENHEMYYYTYNTMGRLMWFSGQPDSALYYFEESIKSIQCLDSSPWNQYYRPALVNGNMAIILQAEGNVTEAIEVTRQAINWLEKFNQLSENESEKLTALKQKLTSIDNLGVYYNSIGEFSQAEKLIEYSYSQKKKYLDQDDINITISLILLGQAKTGTQKPEEAKQLLLQAIKRLENQKNTNVYYRGFAFTTLGSIHESLGENDMAAYYFSKGEQEFRGTMNGDYTKDFLDELADMALFYSKTGSTEKALELANEAWSFTQNGAFKNSLQNYLHLLNKAEVDYNLERYQSAMKLAQEGLEFFDRKKGAISWKDSIQIQFRKPKNLLILAKSKYQLQKNKDEEFYQGLIKLMKESLDILNQRKTTLTAYEDLNLLMSENDEIFQFSMKLCQELYFKTNKKDYLNQLITLHESSVYTRIRTRLNLKDVAFSNVSAPVLEREKQLKKEIRVSLNTDENSGMPLFFESTKKWVQFLDTLRCQHPGYYNMRYASITESLDDLQRQIPKNTTVIRYLFIVDHLFAYLADEKQSELIALDFEPVRNQIPALNDFRNDIETISSAAHRLYLELWQPVEKRIHTAKVLILPDKELFNLSFEMLTPDKISSYEEFLTKSLLSRYTISYNYSLLLLGKNRKTLDFEDDFVAYAPVFGENMKEEYKIAITDSLHLDQTYLTLLPQPFSGGLVQAFSRKFNGNSFLNENASKQIFIKTAGEHKIIHIGTHAESDNVSPELSRLIFAKNISDSASINDNYLYTYEIYNYDLSSKLAILTACETGKPSYQAGEGMISLAHAFNYAGSESILTSLWEIDEQSSSEIIALFYNYLSEGIPKDEALSQAKLDYLATAEGRRLQPQYWAGLILMGSADAIAMSRPFPAFWLYGILSALLLIVVISYRKLKKRKI